MKTPFLLSLALAAALLVARLLAHDAPADGAAAVADSARPRVLVYSDTAYYRHPDIPAINRWLVLLGHENGFDVDVTEHPDDLQPGALAKYDVLLLNNANQLADVIPEARRESVQHWFTQGNKGIVALHAALVHQTGWPWFVELAGCDFDSDSDFLKAKIVVDPAAKDHPAVKGQPAEFWVEADWTNHTRPVTGLPGFQVLLRVDESTYEPVREYFKARGGKPMGADHPIAWTHTPGDGGRFFYTEFGHDLRPLSTPFVRRHILEGIRWAAGDKGKANWPQFRGPGSSGVSADATFPEKWSATENVEWKTDLPGRSWSSPIVWGDRVFITSVVNSGASETPKKGLYFGGDRPKPPVSGHQWKVLCLDLATGQVRWEKTVHAGPPVMPIHLKNSYGAETPVTDRERVYALFGGVGIFALTLDGAEVWSKPIEPRAMRFGWGTAASPVLHGGRLFIVNDNDDHAEMFALDAKTGNELWRVDRQEKSNWATPFVWQNEQRTELVTPGTQAVRSYDLDGKLLWSLGGMSSIAIPTPFAGGGLLFVTSGYVLDRQRPLYAIRPGASGDITLGEGATRNEFIAWSLPLAGPYNTSPLLLDGRVYVLYDRGMLSCYDAKTGDAVYERKRMQDAYAFTASPWAAGGRVFCLDENGVCYVMRAGERFKLLHTNELADDDMCMATPAIAGDRLLIRTSARVYCLRSKQSN